MTPRIKKQRPVSYQRSPVCAGRRLQTGYILLLTLLVISILLAISFGLYAISVKEVILSSFLRDSEKALAAADRGAECALYWDRSYPQNGMFPAETIFATSSSYTPPVNASTAVCDNGASAIQLNSVPATNWTVTPPTVTGATTTFSLNFSDGTCVDVMVAKVGDESTTIVSDGYNTPGNPSNTCNSTVLRRTQREIAVFTNISY